MHSPDWITDNRKGQLPALVTLEELILVFIEVCRADLQGKLPYRCFFQDTHYKIWKKDQKRVSHFPLPLKKMIVAHRDFGSPVLEYILKWYCICASASAINAE